MVTAREAAEIAERFASAPVRAVTGPTARGEQGEMFRLETSDGSGAVNRPFGRQVEDDLQQHAARVRL